MIVIRLGKISIKDYRVSKAKTSNIPLVIRQLVDLKGHYLQPFVMTSISVCFDGSHCLRRSLTVVLI
jgi:hypothetical protein